MTATRVAILTVAALVASSASAQFDLRITEIWPGNDPGDNLTEDWFELTNVGAAAYDASTDGDLWYDDESLDPLDAVMVSGVSTIAPGESVVLVGGGAEGQAEWEALWGAVTALPQVGNFDGAGLSQGGDAVGLFLSSGPVELTDFLTSAGYPDAESTGGQSYDTVLGQFTTLSVPGAVATAVNDMDQPAIGTPGSVVPEPAAMLLTGLAACGLLTVRRR